MPQKADAVMAPEIDIDVDQKYIAELIGITEQPAQFENSRPGDMSMTWKFLLYDMNGLGVMDLVRNEMFELWQFTPDKTYRNVKSGKVAQARLFTEALVGRELTDAEMNELIDLGFEDSLLKKRAQVDLEWYTTRNGVNRLKIIRIKPYKKTPAQTLAAAEDEPTPVVDAAAQRAARRAALGLDNDEAA